MQKCSSLKSINNAVILRYIDRPLNLKNHLPFQVNYENVTCENNEILVKLDPIDKGDYMPKVDNLIKDLKDKYSDSI